MVPAPTVSVRGAAAAIPADGEITGFSYILSADRKYALVEFVARHPKAFGAMRKANVPDVKLFPRHE